MKTAVFSSKRYDREFLTGANQGRHELSFFEPHLDRSTVALAAGFDAICVFVNDTVDAPVLEQLAAGGTRAVALRCAGFNNVDLAAAARLGIAVVRVPAYSPHAVAEHTLGLILALNRNLHRAYNRVREGNFALDGLLGFDLYRRTAGVVGTGRIGAVVARLLRGFDCEVLAMDPFENPECLALGVRYVARDELLARSDIITLHCPLTPENYHLIDAAALGRMKEGAMLINTSRGALVDTLAVINALKSGKLGYLGLDVYEEEGDIFFEDRSSAIIRDDVFTRLLTFPNVLITGHQAFFTRNALEKIAATTVANLSELEETGRSDNQIPPARP
jgi:D-lactate dehydrogenase